MGFPLIIVSGAEIRSAFPEAEAVDIVGGAFIGMASGSVEQSPKFHWELSAGQAAAFASHHLDKPTMSIKINTVRPRDDTRGIPSDISQVLVHDAATGVPVALLDGTAVTSMRTGAAAALGARTLARPSSRVATLIGPGAAGVACIRALLAIWPLNRVHIAGSTWQRRQTVAKELAALTAADIDITASAEEAVRLSDIVFTATASSSPVVRDEWIRPGTHISAMGSDWTGKQELETATLARAYLVADNAGQSITIGELNVPAAAGILGPEALNGEIGDVLTGRIPGRTDEAQVTIFDSSGVGPQDDAVATWILDSAVRLGVGTQVEL